jgi:hypothetical protein
VEHTIAEVMGKQIKDDLKMIRKFDGSHATFKKTYAVPTVTEIEQRIDVPLFGSDGKAKKAVFDSGDHRFAQFRERSPGPATYEPGEPTYILQGQAEAVFGTQAEGDDLIRRDLEKSPFKNPTKLDGPPPDTYNMHSNQTINSFVLPTTDFSAKTASFGKEPKSDSVFKSVLLRDNLASVSQDAKQSPGPGTYISQQMKLVKPDTSVKLAQSPFGTAQ